MNLQVVFYRFRRDALERDAVYVVGSASVRWPLIYSEDLAVLYSLALESTVARETYLGAANVGLKVGRVARAYAKRFPTRRADPAYVSEYDDAIDSGEWARASTLDQLQSGAKAKRGFGMASNDCDEETENADST